MAVRDDFAAGEVLAAADLNDTFASKLPYSYGTATPSTSVDGFLWYDENDTPPTPKFWDGSAFVDFPNGLTLITSESFSAVSSVSVNNCFTASYTNYRLMYRLSGSAATDLLLRLRASGSDASGTNYENQILLGNGSSASASRGSSATGMRLSATRGSASNINTGSYDLFSPQVAATTFLNGFANDPDLGSGIQTLLTSSYHSLSTAYDGFSLLVGSGTITGTIRVYGYKD